MVKVIPPAVSQNEKAMQHLLDDQMLIDLGSNISEFIEEVNFSVNCIEAQTGKIILANSHVGYLHKGIETLQSPNDLIGLTKNNLMEMGCFIPPRILEQTTLKINIDDAIYALLEMEDRLDHEVKMRKVKVEIPFISIRDTGFISSRLLVKKPMLSQDKRKVIAILNCSYDRTHTLSLLEQLQLYRNIYPDKFAIKVLLKHFKIAHFFKAPPTAREMEVLLLMRGNSRRKYIAKQLNIAGNTAASHIQHIKELKLIKPDTDEVVMQLRRVPANLSTN
jgi:hypothetical protein